MASAPSGPSLPFVGQELTSAVYPGVTYSVERVLGQGGTAVAFFATRRSAEGQSPAVVKVIQPRLVIESGQQAMTIVKKEAVALGRLNERVPPALNVVRLLDTGSVEFSYFTRKVELPWIALEDVHGGAEGTTLHDRVSYSVRATRFAFDPGRAARLVEALARGLDEIHGVDVVHRDLTPGNVLCCGAGETEIFKISDFGIAKPMGLAATFGDAIVGTPGYVPPEQIGGDAPVGPQSDVFSLAAIIYFALTGQAYFDVTTPTQALVAVGTPNRRSVLESRMLCQELRDNEAACQAIDMTLARATAPKPAQRPKSAGAFAKSLLPWLREPSGSGAGKRWMSSMQLLQVPESLTGGSWTVRHPPGDERILISVAWNASGHCLAASTAGLTYWDGVRWAPASLSSTPRPGGVHFVRRLTSTTWLLGGDGGYIAEYTPDGLNELARGRDPNVRFLDAHGDPRDFCVVMGMSAGGAPELHTAIAGRWLKPVVVTEAATLSGVARIDDTRWLVVGRHREGRAYAAIYHPLDWQLDPLEVPKSRALLDCASRPERRMAVAVGTDGAIVRVERDRVETEVVDSGPDLATVAIDVLGHEWAAGAGSMWARHMRRPYKRVWHDDSWHSPIISVNAETGIVTAVSVDGGVLEGRAPVLDPTRPG